MTNFVFPPHPQASLAIEGTEDRFPVRRIYCVGRNYAAHAREMGNDDRDSPFFFTKPADAVVENGSTIPFPTMTDDLHFEMELVVAIGRDGADISEDQALEHVFAYGTGIDLTRRDMQAAAKAAKRPWDLSKGFDRSAPMSALHPVSDLVGHPAVGRIWLKKNGVIKQDADLAEQIWSVPEIIAHLSRAIELKAGDVIMSRSESPDKHPHLKSGQALLIADETAYPALVGIL
ncbi:MAG: fumarylacetoacetate hydrolase family protein, partial [Alphaproteobacteria bacterium]